MTIATVRSAAAARVPLAHALDLGPEAWDQLLTRSGLSNPFLTWAWYCACAVAVPAAVVDSCHAVVLRGATGDLEGVLPFRANGDRFWGVPVRGAGWAFGVVRRPGLLDLLAS